MQDRQRGKCGAVPFLEPCGRHVMSVPWDLLMLFAEHRDDPVVSHRVWTLVVPANKGALYTLWLVAATH